MTPNHLETKNTIAQYSNKRSRKRQSVTVTLCWVTEKRSMPSKSSGKPAATSGSTPAPPYEHS